MNRRPLLVGTLVAVAGVAGCSSLSGQQAKENSIETEGVATNVSVEAVTVRVDDLDSNWTGGLHSADDVDGVESVRGEFESDKYYAIVRTEKYADIESAQQDFTQLRQFQTDGLSAGSVEYGTEGYIIAPFNARSIISFRIGNLIHQINVTSEEPDLANPEQAAREMADIVIEKIERKQAN